MVKNQHVSRKYQVWAIVSLMFIISIERFTPEAKQAIFVGAWTSYLMFTGGILGINWGEKGTRLHHQRNSNE